jgi:hypothetical protein
MAEKMYGHLVKGVVDIEKDIIVLDAELHADQESYLLQNGSAQEHLWGFNLHPNEYGTEEFIEFDSMINIRPRQKNMSRDVQDANIRQTMTELILKRVQR